MAKPRVLTERLHCMLSARQMNLVKQAAALADFASEGEVIRKLVDEHLPDLVAERGEVPRGYGRRTRVLVDTTLTRDQMQPRRNGHVPAMVIQDETAAWAKTDLSEHLEAHAADIDLLAALQRSVDEARASRPGVE